MSAATQYEQVRTELDAECARVGRDPKEVLLLAVSKTVDVDKIELAMQAGAYAFGENRPDELLRKQKAFPDAEWHFIGNIQSRRIADIVSAATLIHSVCKESHLAKIDAAAAAIGKTQRVLLEVNVSGEESKSGFAPEEVQGVIDRGQGLQHVAIEGLMTMAPQGDDEAIVATFSGLQQLKADLDGELSRGGRARLSALSMGMSEDWCEALRFGTTIVRIGRAIFDEAFA